MKSMKHDEMVRWITDVSRVSAETGQGMEGGYAWVRARAAGSRPAAALP